MGGKKTPGLRRRGTYGIWSIQKTIQVGGQSIRLCETTGASSLEEAERFLAKRIADLRSVHIYGEPSPLTLAEAAERYLEECSAKSYERAEYALANLCRALGHLQVAQLHDGTVQPYIRERLKTVSAGTIKRELSVLISILNRCARRWRNDAGHPYLQVAPAITRPTGKRRAPYPLSNDEETRLLAKSPPHLEQHILFALHTGCRAGEITKLRWEWEVQVPELGVSVFVLPEGEAKNNEERVVVLNAVARRVTDERRGEHSEFVFSWKGEPLRKLSNSSWKKAKARSKLPIRFHDLRHTFGHRLRAVGAPVEDRKALLGHTNGEITTHYSAAELGTLLKWVEAIVDAKPGTALRTGFAANVVELRQKRGNLPR